MNNLHQSREATPDEIREAAGALETYEPRPSVKQAHDEIFDALNRRPEAGA